ncbi:protein SIX6OS1 [Sphaerodactylus townsendi]|uniref:protein SIX6OS1 n=1 Tax=Sphaerodactylus townsendi TaxID=933632 RepID=UPI002026CE0E|nr:protein SIX6OS1 [Sphaerodactylus townsendi]
METKPREGYKMNDDVLSSLDKLLLQFVFKLEQASYSKKHLRQQIQIYNANLVGKKGKICWLQEEINKNEEVIVSLQHNNSSKNCNVWKPTYVILNKHEEYLRKELQDCMKTTEKDKNMYQDYMNQYEEAFKQHQSKYLGMEGVKKQLEFEEIRNRVLRQSELIKQKESEIMDLQEPGQFQSLLNWASQIASLRQNTKESLQHVNILKEQSLELDNTADDLEKKLNSFRQQLERVTEDQSHCEEGEEKSEKNYEKRKESDNSLFEAGGQVPVLNEEHQKYKLLHFTSVSQKFVRSLPTLKPLFQQAETGVQEKEDSAKHPAVTSMYFSPVENETQKCNDAVGTYRAKPALVTSITSLQKETPFRLTAYQRQTSSKQWLGTEAAETGKPAEKEMDITEKEVNKLKNNPYVSQALKICLFLGRFSFSPRPAWIQQGYNGAFPTHLLLGALSGFPTRPKMSGDGGTERSVKSAGRNSASEECTENFPRSPESGVKTPRSSGTPFEVLPAENDGVISKSPAFSFLSSFNAKSPGFNFFDSSVFGTEQSPDQAGKNYSAGHLNPVSPHEPIGDLFGKMESEDSFAFSFPSCSSVQDGKDDFSFPFAFGCQPGSQKGFQSSSQSRKTFSLF